MKAKSIFNLFILLLAVHPTFSQRLTFGIESGINFSNLHKTYDYDRFDAMPGPVNGIATRYQLGNWFNIQSGINFTTLYFSESSSYAYYDYYYQTGLSSSSITAPDYTHLQTSKFSFLRLPLLIKFRTPGRVNFEIGGGAYYSFLTNDEFRGKDRDIYTKEFIDENFPKMNDWGWVLESSLNYNINNRWSIFTSARITYGHEKYYENVEGKLGSTEFLLGVGYAPFKANNYALVPDSIGENLTLLPFSGFLISKVRTDANKGEYRYLIGFSSGVSLKFRVGPNASFLTGAWYERKGYNLDYPGNYMAFYQPSPDDNYSDMQSDVQLDYLTIPFLMDINFGRKIMNHVNFGAYFSLLQNVFAEGVNTISTNYSNGYRISKEYFNESLDEWFENVDAGFVLAYRIDVPLWDWASTFYSVNYAIGINNILNQSQEFQTQYSFLENTEMHNSSVGFQFGLSISVNKN